MMELLPAKCGGEGMNRLFSLVLMPGLLASSVGALDDTLGVYKAGETPTGQCILSSVLMGALAILVV